MLVHAIENGYEECQQTIKGAVEIETLSLNFWQSLYLTAFSSMLYVVTILGSSLGFQK